MLNVYATKQAKSHLPKRVHNPVGEQLGLKVRKAYAYVGPTGSGKSSAWINLLLRFYDTFQKVYVFTLDSDEPLYNMLRENLRGDIVFGDIRNLPRVDDDKVFDKEAEKLVVFDDFVACGRDVMQRLGEFAISARKHKMTSIYCAQSFYAIPPKIRQQFAYIVLLKMTDERNLTGIVSSMGIQLEKPVIKAIIRNATRHKMNVCLIDLEEDDLNRKFRRNYDEFYRVLDDGHEIPLNQIQMYEGSGIVN
jgi:hypothetical protein